MPVDGVGGSTAAQLMYNRNDVAGTSEELTMTDFYKLMAAQMQYQDPDNPMDTSELMAQMVQSKMITAIAQMTSISTTTYATSMLGTEVTVAEVDEKGVGTGEYTKGKVTGVVLGDNGRKAVFPVADYVCRRRETSGRRGRRRRRRRIWRFGRRSR